MPGALTHAGHAAQVKRLTLIGHVAQNDRPTNSTLSYDGASPMTPPVWQQIQTLPVDDIQVEERLRTASETAVASIVSSIQEVGSILQPLLVRRVKDGYRLLDGLHRLTAAKEAGLAEVPVKVSECTNDQAIRIEVDANVAKRAFDAAGYGRVSGRTHPLQKCPATIKHLNLSKPPYVKKIYIKP
ncbi:ParB/RepB/Spo0J family partition protein [Phaeobacter sp. BS34]